MFIRADALEIDDIFRHEISHVYLNFSDPWPKNRHHLRRLSSRIFLEKYEKIFQEKKVIEMRTDNIGLFQYSLIQFSEFGYVFRKLSFDLHKDDMPLITTEYEDKFVSIGKNIYYLEALK